MSSIEALIATAGAAGWRVHSLGQTEEGLWTAELRHPTRTAVFVAATAPCTALGQALAMATRGRTPGPAIPLREPVMAEGLL